MNEGQRRTCDVEHVAHHGGVVPTPHHQQAAWASSGFASNRRPFPCCYNVYDTRRDWTGVYATLNHTRGT